MLKIYDKVTYRFGEIINAEVSDSGKDWALVRWDCSPHYPDWIEITDRYRIINTVIED